MKTRIDENRPIALKVFIAFLTSLLAITILAGCGGAKSAIVGKWEVVDVNEEGGLETLLFGNGQIVEFTKDGTVIFSDWGMAADYSWLDKSRLKISGNQFDTSVVLTVELQDDNLFLSDANGEPIAHLQRYAELTPSPEALAGAWDMQDYEGNDCFAVLENDAPGRISFGEDGSFQVDEGFGTILGGEATALGGHYTFHDDHLRIEISGKKREDSLFNGSKETDISGVIDCAVTLTHSRLTFKDDQGNTTLYVRGKP